MLAISVLRPPPPPLAAVLVTTTDLSAGHVLTDADVSVAAVPEAGAVPVDAGCYCPRCLAELIAERRARLAPAVHPPVASR